MKIMSLFSDMLIIPNLLYMTPQKTKLDILKHHPAIFHTIYVLKWQESPYNALSGFIESNMIALWEEYEWMKIEVIIRW